MRKKTKVDYPMHVVKENALSDIEQKQILLARKVLSVLLKEINAKKKEISKLENRLDRIMKMDVEDVSRYALPFSILRKLDKKLKKKKGA